jgi:hypothetical protein
MADYKNRRQLLINKKAGELWVGDEHPLSYYKNAPDKDYHSVKIMKQAYEHEEICEE